MFSLRDHPKTALANLYAALVRSLSSYVDRDVQLLLIWVDGRANVNHGVPTHIADQTVDSSR